MRREGVTDDMLRYSLVRFTEAVAIDILNNSSEDIFKDMREMLDWYAFTYSGVEAPHNWLNWNEIYKKVQEEFRIVYIKDGIWLINKLTYGL